VVAVVIPTTILLTLFAAWLMGYTLNRVSLFALIFSIGILVDDAIVVIENIARHWAHEGRPLAHAAAAIDAVAEVGNPTIVATLTVVAALLPMLFVSGMMGPYMSPIPANASAAMMFSFFVAVIGDALADDEDRRQGAACGAMAAWRAHGGGCWGAPIAAVAAAGAGVQAARLDVPAGLVGVATLLLARPVLHQDVTVKLLPFDNKSELPGVVDLPEGRVGGGDRDACCRRRRSARRRARRCLGPDLCRHGRAVQLQRPGAPLYLRASTELGDIAGQPRRQGTNAQAHQPRHRARHARQRSRPRHAGGTSLKVVEPPPGPPVMATLLAEIYGPDATRRAVAEKVREAFERVPFIVDVDDSSYGTCATRVRVDRPGQSRVSRVEEGDVYDTLRALYGGADGRLFASRRGRNRSRSARPAEIDRMARNEP
jgi:multidrug efflux pump subunit AcrB